MLNETEHNVILQYNFISQQLTKYAGILLYILCFFGTMMNILSFKCQTYRNRSCSLYLLIASLFDFLHLNLGPLSNIIEYGFNYNWAIHSIAFCKIKHYLNFIFSVISATLTTFVSIERYILSSRKNARWKYCTRPFAVRCIQFTILFWLIISIPILFCYTRSHHISHNEQFVCSNTFHSFICRLTQLLYICIFNGFLPPIIMMIFSLLTCRNIQQLRQRSLLKSVLIQTTNYQITTMFILQSIKSSFTSLPFAIFNTYLLLTNKMPKSALNQAKENLIYQIVYLLFWSNYTSFFVYMYSSDIFRKQWTKTLRKLMYYLRKSKQSKYYYRTQLVL
ncbi:hypothetical protein I4U23_028277 [Adineta vaga]|nr:hypothetical protein I4U23_028277 [Adineta vaga]